jgi:P pilus assembly chaperone PapD
MDLCFRIVFLLLSFLFAPQIFANVYEVTPTQLFLSSKQMVGTVKLTNHSNESGLLQLSLLDWQQCHGKNVYQVSHDILLTPPIFRLHIKEVQQPRQKKLGQTLYFLMDLSLGLFVQPQHIIEQYIWSAERPDPKHIKLKLYNDGNVTLFIKQWQLLPADQQGLTMKKHSTFTYILPRQSHDWLVKVEPNNQYTEIKSNINGKTKKSVLHRL